MPVKADTVTPLGRAIRGARDYADLSGTELGAAVGVDQSLVSRWELGKAKPDLDQLAAIERACGLPAGTLFRAGGYVGDVGEVEAAILAEGRFTKVQREGLLLLVHTFLSG